eukprot:8650067-Lingulodinium_polyedra.AAC.1
MVKHDGDPTWPLRGPCAVIEFIIGVLATGLSFSADWSYWVQQSGICRDASCAYEMKVVCDFFHLAL